MVSNSDAAKPTQHIAMSACEPLPTHRRVGANHKRVQGPNDCATAARYLPAGRMPAGPIRPRI